MRSSMLLPLLLAALCCSNVSAEWFRWSGGRGAGPSWPAYETGLIADSTQLGWTPKPTPAPGAATPDGERVLDLLLQRQETATNWTNSETCGWIPGVSSKPFTCDGSGTCATNSEHIVACVSDTLSLFYSTCLNYAAWQSSSCIDDGSETGCCLNSDYGECATYFWTGKPVRSMYRCVTSATIVTMLDEPQYIIDASLSSASVASVSRHHNDDDKPTATYHPGSSHTDTNAQPTPANSPSKRNLGLIIGVSIGGFFGVLLLGYLCFSCRTRRKAAKKDHEQIRKRLDNVFRYWDPSPSPDWALAIQADEPGISSTAATAATSHVSSRYAPVPETPTRTRTHVRPRSSVVNGAGPSYQPLANGQAPRVHSFPYSPSYGSSASASQPRPATPSRSQRANGPPSYNWYLMSPTTGSLQSQGELSATMTVNSDSPARVGSQMFSHSQSGTLPNGQGTSTPPPTYSYANPYPDATPHSVADGYATPRTVAGPYHYMNNDSDEEEEDGGADNRSNGVPVDPK